MKRVLDHVSVCRSLSQQLGTNLSLKDPTSSLMALYDFEAKLLLSPAELDEILEQVSQNPCAEAKTLETMAALCICTQNSGNVCGVCVYM